MGANGAGKSTLLKLAIDELEPQRGHIQRLTTAVCAPQRTDEPPQDDTRFLDSLAERRWILEPIDATTVQLRLPISAP